MTKQSKPFILSVVLLGLVGMSGLSYASPRMARLEPAHPKMMPLKPAYKHHCMRKLKPAQRKARSWRRVLRPQRYYSVDQARVVAQAALIQYGQQDLRVGKIDKTTNKKGQARYLIKITTPQQKPFRTIMMNPKNGMVRIAPQGI